MKKTWFVLFIALLGSSALADVVTLKNGQQITGTVESAGSKQLLIKVGDDAQVISMDQIASIQFNPLLETAAAPAPPEPPAPPAAPLAPAVPSVPAPPVPPAPLSPPTVPAPPTPAAAPRPTLAAEPVLAPAPAAPPVPTGPAAPSASITIPAGTEIAARTVERIDSKKADKYKEYAASLDDPLVVNGVTIAPVNSNAILRITEIKNPKLKGHAMLATTLVAVIVNGRRIDLKTDDVDSQSGSQSKRTAIGAGGGAAGGAAIGAAAGGGAGAAVGAGIGAAAGAIGAALTSKGVQIPPETRFTYKLTQDAVIDNPKGTQ